VRWWVLPQGGAASGAGPGASAGLCRAAARPSHAGRCPCADIDHYDSSVRVPLAVRNAVMSSVSISSGTPVAEHIRTGYTTENRPVRVMISIIPGDTLILKYTIPT